MLTYTVSLRKLAEAESTVAFAKFDEALLWKLKMNSFSVMPINLNVPVVSLSHSVTLILTTAVCCTELCATIVPLTGSIINDPFVPNGAALLYPGAYAILEGVKKLALPPFTLVIWYERLSPSASG